MRLLLLRVEMNFSKLQRLTPWLPVASSMNLSWPRVTSMPTWSYSDRVTNLCIMDKVLLFLNKRMSKLLAFLAKSEIDKELVVRAALMGMDEQNMKSEHEALLLKRLMSETESSCGSIFSRSSMFKCLGFYFLFAVLPAVIYSSGSSRMQID